MAKSQILLGSAQIVYYIDRYLSELKYCSIQSWPRGGHSSLPMVPTTRNLTAHPLHLQSTRFALYLKWFVYCTHLNFRPYIILIYLQYPK